MRGGNISDSSAATEPYVSADSSPSPSRIATIPARLAKLGCCLLKSNPCAANPV